MVKNIFSKNSLCIYLCLTILIVSCMMSNIIEPMYPEQDIDEYKDAISLYRRNGVNNSINNLIKKYHDDGDVGSDTKLKDFFIDTISIKNLDNCSTIKGYPVLFMCVLHRIHFLTYNELLEKYPKMISSEEDYLKIKTVYTCAHNMYDKATIQTSCNQLMKTNCSAQLAPMVSQIHTSIDYFVNKEI